MAQSAKKAFTLLELLVVVAILGLLVTFVIVSLRAVRGSAARAESLSALRQMALAHASYATDHRHQLLPGYVDVTLLADGAYFGTLVVPAPDGSPTDLDDRDAQSYVWRLSPYLDGAWDTLFTDLNDKGQLSRVQAEFDKGIFGPSGNGPMIPGGISERPAYGLNSIFVGGDSRHGGTYVTDRNPWTPSAGAVIAATRTSEVKNPSRLVLFAPSVLVDETIALGFCELRPPFVELDSAGSELIWRGAQWIVGEGGRIELGSAAETGAGMGLPVDRTSTGSLPVGHLDGSSATVGIPELAADMGRWDPKQVGKRRMEP